jgi:hypothetical protein
MKPNSRDTTIVMVEATEAQAYVERLLAIHNKNNTKKKS